MGATTPPAPAPNPPARPPATFADIAFGPHVHHRLTARQSPTSLADTTHGIIGDDLPRDLLEEAVEFLTLGQLSELAVHG